MNWQPIETAPFDTQILLIDGDYMTVWERAKSGSFQHVIHGEGPARAFRPTHWMPLPEPPQ